MAHWTKYKRTDVSNVLKEAYRELKNYKSEVDKEKSKYNIYLKDDNYKKAFSRFKEKIKEIPPKRKDAVLMISECITIPRELKQEDYKKFSQIVLEYNDKLLGKENRLHFALHKDEPNARPHIQTSYMPIQDGKWNAKKIMDRDFLKNYHKGLQEECEKKLGYYVLIENEEKGKHLSFEEFKKTDINYYKNLNKHLWNENIELKEENNKLINENLELKEELSKYTKHIYEHENWEKDFTKNTR